MSAQKDDIASKTTTIPLSDANDLDAAIHALGIEDSDTTPAEAVAELKAEIERLHGDNRVMATSLRGISEAWGDPIKSAIERGLKQ